MGDSEPRSVEEVFIDFKGRRAAIIKALTTDFDEFYRQCDPEKDNLCLYGFPDERWEVKIPTEEVPPLLPEPILGINFPRDHMEQKDWAIWIAIYSDSWLYSIAFYFCSRFGYDRADRRRLFDMINDLPMISEVVLEAERAQSDSGEEDDNIRGAICAACNIGSVRGACWILCNTCNRWLHMKCVNITPEMVDHMEEYECPSCSHKRAQSDSGEEDNDIRGAICAACNIGSIRGACWILCNTCNRWFHMKCVNITPEMVDHMKEYECPPCSHKRART